MVNSGNSAHVNLPLDRSCLMVYIPGAFPDYAGVSDSSKLSPSFQSAVMAHRCLFRQPTRRQEHAENRSSEAQVLHQVRFVPPLAGLGPRQAGPHQDLRRLPDRAGDAVTQDGSLDRRATQAHSTGGTCRDPARIPDGPTGADLRHGGAEGYGREAANIRPHDIGSLVPAFTEGEE